MAWYDVNPPRWAWLLLGVFLGAAILTDAYGRQAPMREAAAPPLAIPLGPMPADPDEREGWVERIVERRMERALDTDPTVRGPVTDFLAQKLMEFVGRVVRGAIEAAVALALTAFVVGWLKSHWYWLGGGYLLHLALSWFAGRHGGKATQP